MAQDEEEEVPADFECSICMKLLFEPVSVPCGHNFCRACLQRSLDYRSLCAVCRAPVAGGQSVNILLRNIIADKYPRALASRRQELQEELLAGERAAEEERRRNVQGSVVAAGAPPGDAVLLPILRAEPPLPQGRLEFKPSSAEQFRMFEYAVQGGRRVGILPPGADAGDASPPIGVCAELEGMQHEGERGNAPVAKLKGKFRFRLVEPSQVHPDGFELARCEAMFDEPLPQGELLLMPTDGAAGPVEAGDGEDERARSTAEVAKESMELVERQLQSAGQGGRHWFYADHGEAPTVLRGQATTSAGMEQLSFWLLAALAVDATEREHWLRSTDTRGRLQACHDVLVSAKGRLVLSLPGVRSWMSPGSSNSLALLLVVIALLAAKAMGLFDQRSRGGHMHWN